MKFGVLAGYVISVIAVFTWAEMGSPELSEKVSRLYQIIPIILCVTFGIFSSYILKVERDMNKIKGMQAKLGDSLQD
nr:hypothetical protein [uncultured Pseudomonas sp.]